MSGPKEDRLKLYRATGFNLSPVFGLYPDADDEVFKLLEPLVRTAPPLVAKDHLGVTNRLWTITDSATISKVIGLMGPKPVYIADGHHRYETGVKYLEERREAGEVPDDEAAPNFCLMMLVGMSDPGLLILPTHRLVSGLAADVTARSSNRAGRPLRHRGADGRRERGVGARPDGRVAVGAGVRHGRRRAVDGGEVPRARGDGGTGPGAERRVARAGCEHPSPAGAGPARPRPRRRTPVCKYVHLMSEVTDATSKKECQLACLVPPATMGHVERIAGHGEKMPPKSTYFYPKLLTGLVFNSLKKD
jgi:uncharacterized protein (DUF1015 family)